MATRARHERGWCTQLLIGVLHAITHIVLQETLGWARTAIPALFEITVPPSTAAPPSANDEPQINLVAPPRYALQETPHCLYTGCGRCAYRHLHYSGSSGAHSGRGADPNSPSGDHDPAPLRMDQRTRQQQRRRFRPSPNAGRVMGYLGGLGLNDDHLYWIQLLVPELFELDVRRSNDDATPFHPSTTPQQKT